MKINFDKSDNTEIIEFNSISEFYKYISTTPVNNAFKGKRLESIDRDFNFTGTHSFDEAVDLLKNGWSEESAKLTNKIKALEKSVKPSTKGKNFYSVSGYQAIVPLYIQGDPQCMMSRKQVATKQKVVTIDKCITYNCDVSKETIEDESIKALMVIKKFEAMQYRVNLNIIFAAHCGNKSFVVKVKVKDANERLNISKVAFPLVNPSMLRRLFFRFEEVHPTITSDFTWAYGHPIYSERISKYLDSNEYVIPEIISKDITKINNLVDLKTLK
jgi:hypothetical protein